MKKEVVLCPAQPIYDSVPLTVEVQARLKDSAHYNILVANQDKPSHTHCEMFSLPGSGCLGWYNLP